MNESETEQERKIREYWSKAYDSLNSNKDRQYEPTAVLTTQSQRNTNQAGRK